MEREKTFYIFATKEKSFQAADLSLSPTISLLGALNCLLFQIILLIKNSFVKKIQYCKKRNIFLFNINCCKLLSDSWKCCSENRICSNNDEAELGRHREREERNKVYFPKNASAVGLLYYREIYLLNIFVRFTSLHSPSLIILVCAPQSIEDVSKYEYVDEH